MAVILVLPNSRSEVSGYVRSNGVGSSAQKRSVTYNSLTHTLVMLVHGKKVLPHHVIYQVVIHAWTDTIMQFTFLIKSYSYNQSLSSDTLLEQVAR